METAVKLFDERVAELLTLLQNAITNYGPEAWELTAMGIRANIFSGMTEGVIWTLVLVVVFGFLVPRAASRSRAECIADPKKSEDWECGPVFWAICMPRVFATAAFFIIGVNSWGNVKAWAMIIEPKLYLVYKTLGMIS